MIRRTGAQDLVRRARADAIEAVRTLDAAHFARVGEVLDEWAARWRPHERDAVRPHIREITDLLASCVAVGIAGGHVVVLLNRLLLFDMRTLIGERPVIAWSAGAMTVCDRIVLFYDHPPHGRGNAEILGPGLGLVRDVVPLPHARHRLFLDDVERVGLFARRFAPSACVPMDEGARLDANGAGFAAPRGTLRFAESGSLVALEAA